MDERVAAWAASGAMALTGRPGRAPLGPPAPLVDGLRSWGATLSARSGGATPEPLTLLGERAAVADLHRQGATSCGGTSRLVATVDGWLAVSMARADDVAAVAAWLELDEAPADPWAALVAAAATRRADQLEERAVLLGLPVAVLATAARPVDSAPAPFAGLPVRVTAHGRARPLAGRTPTVVDLSSLWAGPLCGHLLALAGARVIKVESTDRPDGARFGPAGFFDLMNAGKASVALDLSTGSGIDALQRLVAAADVVIEASRPRALAGLGVIAEQHLAAPDGPRAWISITGYGRQGHAAARVAFGDDAAVGGGLVVWDEYGPCFCADAVADPVTGVVAAAAALAALTDEGRWLVDVAMADVAARLAGPTLDAAGWDGPVAPARSRSRASTAAPLGRDTAAVLAALPALP